MKQNSWRRHGPAMSPRDCVVAPNLALSSAGTFRWTLRLTWAFGVDAYPRRQLLFLYDFLGVPNAGPEALRDRYCHCSTRSQLGRQTQRRLSRVCKKSVASDRACPRASRLDHGSGPGRHAGDRRDAHRASSRPGPGAPRETRRARSPICSSLVSMIVVAMGNRYLTLTGGTRFFRRGARQEI